MIPSFEPNADGDVNAIFNNPSEDKKEVKKLIYDRKTYESVILIDPVDNSILSFKCKCPNFQIERRGKEFCKHLIKNVKRLKELGLKLIYSDLIKKQPEKYWLISD